MIQIFQHHSHYYCKPNYILYQIFNHFGSDFIGYGSKLSQNSQPLSFSEVHRHHFRHGKSQFTITITTKKSIKQDVPLTREKNPFNSPEK